MTRWYRAYEGTASDPKLAEASMAAGCTRAVAVAAWHLILESAAATNDRGRFETSPRRIAAALCESLAPIESLFDAFAEIGLIAGTHVAAWERRQFTSDSSTERARRHRAKKKEGAGNGDATLHNVAATAPYTETETYNSEANASADEPPARAIDVVKIIFDTGLAILTASGTTDRQARSIVGRWRKTYSDAVVLAVLSRCQVENPSEPVEWVGKALQCEARNAKGNDYGQTQQPARASLREIGERVAQRFELANHG